MGTITVTKHHADMVKSLKEDLLLFENALKAMKPLVGHLATATRTIDELNFKVSQTTARIAELSNY